MGVHSFVPTTTLSSHKWNKCCALLSFQRVSMDGIGCQRYCDHPWTDNSLPPPSEYPWMPGQTRNTISGLAFSRPSGTCPFHVHSGHFLFSELSQKVSFQSYKMSLKIFSQFSVSCSSQSVRSVSEPSSPQSVSPSILSEQ